MYIYLTIVFFVKTKKYTFNILNLSWIKLTFYVYSTVGSIRQLKNIFILTAFPCCGTGERQSSDAVVRVDVRAVEYHSRLAQG